MIKLLMHNLEFKTKKNDIKNLNIFPIYSCLYSTDHWQKYMTVLQPKLSYQVIVYGLQSRSIIFHRHVTIADERLQNLSLCSSFIRQRTSVNMLSSEGTSHLVAPFDKPLPGIMRISYSNLEPSCNSSLKQESLQISFTADCLQCSITILM